MVAEPDRHSRIVGWLKILLPLTALALLSTLFLFARQTGAPPVVDPAELDRIASEQRLNAPRLSGVTDDGTEVQISATAARPEGDDRLIIADPRMVALTPTGNQITIVADEAAIDQTAQEARFTGLARLDTSTGYMMETTGLVADLEGGTVTSLGPLEILAPFGTLTAGKVSVATGSGDIGYALDFTEGVTMLYQPGGMAATEGSE